MRIAACAILGFGCVLLAEDSVRAQNLSTYGTPGLIDMPSAEVLPTANLAFTGAAFKDTARGTITFQMLPWVYGSFRYSYIKDFNRGGAESRYDRSFDIHFRLREETARGPAIGVGFRDFGGTGIYGSEYVVLTKTFAERWKVTGGMGWGRLGQRNSFKNPLAVFDDKFETRPPRGTGSTGGKLAYDQWFRGPAALFGGLEYRLNDRLSLLAEYSSDEYQEEKQKIGFDADFPLNFGVNYKFRNGVNMNASYMYGNTLGLQLSYAFDPRNPLAPGGLDRAAPALKPQNQVAAESWNLPDQDSDMTARDVLRARLDKQGLRMTGYGVEGNRAIVEIENNRFSASAQAAGRTARTMANTLDPSIEVFDITLLKNGVPINTIETQRSDLYELENDVDGAWRTLARSVIRDEPYGLPPGTVPGAFPHTGYRFGPYLRLSFFDPDNPLRYELGAEFKGDYVVQPGLFLTGALRVPIIGNLDETTRVSDSVLPHVRSDWAEYARNQSSVYVQRLTAAYLWRPGEDLFARVSGGYLEEMFGGVSAEMLWYPNDSRLALGAEINYAKKRDYDMLFGFQSYDVVTGHGSMYYDLGNEYNLQIDAGRYLAGDWGATFTLDKEFNNGFKVGAFATFTNVSAEEFGEGSFDKGIRFEVPVSWLTGKPTRSTVKQTIRPVLRDGGARLIVDNRLHEYTRDERAGRLVGQWGRFYR
ncbi:YjbH domain-containing protein [Primorskyibacter sp. S87]|uniref:YjbH domain-containing protein n=1 Tax=Primorskyibacter sp. S87 TaxID=3415126 RepID=UPI003C7C96DE